MNTFSVPVIIKSAAKLFTALALASGTAALLPNCTSETSAEIVGRERLALACNCPTDSGTCGIWTCSGFNNECTFKAADGAREGERCTSAGSEDGTCMVVALDERTTYLMCCTGCVAGETEGEKTCQSGSEIGYCGDRGSACDGCTECQSCTGGACKETTGNDCGTCKVCSAGNCVDKDPGAACQGGRCALAATCCSSCIDSGGACLSSTNEHCGLAGAGCRDCGECGTCANGTCQQTTGGGCDDGNPCTDDDTCANGTCAGTPVPTDDGNDCTVDGCDTQGITHTNVMPGTTCEDGAMCTSGETCNDHDNMATTPFTCLAPMGIDCTDGNPCTSDTPPCGGSMECPHTPEMDGTPCSNDLRCVFNKSCQSGECTGEARNCNDDNPCTTDSCDEMDGPNVDPVTGCKHEPRSTSTTCDDSNACTESDHCTSDGSCAGTVKGCTALDECHGIGSCDPGAGECTDPRLQDGTACENTGVCADGECQGGTPVGSGGSSGAGGGAQGGEGGDTTGDAGESSEAGSAGATGGGSGGRGGSGGSGGGVGGTSASGGSSGADSTLYVRDPGGCSCRVAGSGPGSTGYLGALVASVLALVVRRRRAA